MKSAVYTHLLKVIPEDLDELNHVNNIIYLRYVQDAAINHWYSAVPKNISDALRWVVRRHEVDYLKPAFGGDVLHVKTWVEAFTGVTSDRHCEIYRGDELLVKSRTLWVALDAQTLKPRRVGTEVTEHFFGE